MDKNTYENIGKLFVDWIVANDPAMRRRIDSLPSLIQSLGLVRVVAEANRKPSLLCVTAFGRVEDLGQRGEQTVDHVNELGSGMREDEIRLRQFPNGVDCCIGTPRPKDDVGIGGVQHSNVALEPSDALTEVNEANMLAFANKFEDGVFHSLENAYSADLNPHNEQP